MLHCPICNYRIVEPAGPLQSKILLAGEFPGYEEMREGIPFTGKTGDVLRIELAKVGISFETCRMTNLWMHEKNDKCNQDYHIKKFMEEADGRAFILLMGSDTSKSLFGMDIMRLSGLVVRSHMFPSSLIVFSPNPAIAFHGRAGEMQLAFRRFGELARGDYQDVIVTL